MRSIKVSRTLMFLVVVYVHVVVAVTSNDSASFPKAIFINATTMKGTGPVYVPTGSNLTILGISPYVDYENWFGGLAKITVRYEMLATNSILNIQLGDKSVCVPFCYTCAH